MKASAGRIAALRHEAGDDAMEEDSVIETLVGQRGDALDMPGRQVGPKLDDDVAAGGKGKGQAIVGHFALHWLQSATI